MSIILSEWNKLQEKMQEFSIQRKIILYHLEKVSSVEEQNRYLRELVNLHENRSEVFEQIFDEIIKVQKQKKLKFKKLINILHIVYLEIP